MCDVMVTFRCLFLYIDRFRESLYNQKHAFYFRKVTQWMTCLCVSFEAVSERYIYNVVQEWTD